MVERDGKGSAKESSGEHGRSVTELGRAKQKRVGFDLGPSDLDPLARNRSTGMKIGRSVQGRSGETNIGPTGQK